MIHHLVLLATELVGKGAEENAVFDLAVTAFWGMAHLAELTYNHESGAVSRQDSLLTTDVSFRDPPRKDTALLTLRSAKTCGPGVTQELQIRRLNNMLCPVLAVEQQMVEANVAETSLFGFYSNGKRVHLTRRRVVAMLIGVWHRNGMNGLSGHSFRVGGASLRFALGIPTTEICQLGRWVSDCYQLYIRSYTDSDVLDTRSTLEHLTKLWQN